MWREGEGGAFTGYQNTLFQEEIVKLLIADICLVGNSLGCLGAPQKFKLLVFFSRVIYESKLLLFPLYSLVSDGLYYTGNNLISCAQGTPWAHDIGTGVTLRN